MGASTPPPPDPSLSGAASRACGPSHEQHGIAGRYQVRQELGRGGLAVVFRVFDTVLGHEVALKQLALQQDHRQYDQEASAFEREYHTLVQLSHPRIIEVYDFGSDDGLRYYTMELLEGRDLRDRAPLPWREACAIAFDVCSSLSLLHSRRLVHRDVSPRNVRTTSDGTAKLIDFGTLAPMGPCGRVIGTPAFVAPEVAHRSALDGRTDLFSLGATLYLALTGCPPYPASSFRALLDAWTVRPPAPSRINQDIPPALDALVLSLISLDPAARPRSAFEVMQYLSTIAGLEHAEDIEVSQAYLAAPVLVGRDEALERLRGGIEAALAGHGRGILASAEAGVGRSRLLDACALEAKIMGAPVLRINADGVESAPLAVARAFATQVLESMPDHARSCAQREHATASIFAPAAHGDVHEPVTLADVPDDERERAAHHEALTRWLLRVAQDHPLVVLIDDVHLADQGSLALIAALALSATDSKLLLLSTMEDGAEVADPEALAVLRRECQRLDLAPLGIEQTEELVQSLFGDVPNVGLVADRLHKTAWGRPREIMTLVQALVDNDVIRYRDGHWQLPDSLSENDLPSDAAEAYLRAVQRLSPLARILAQTHALASHGSLTRNDYAAAAPEAAASELDSAISELLAANVLASDGRDYTLSRREWSRALLDGLEPAQRRELHLRLTRVYGSETFVLERAEHLLHAGEDAHALDVLIGQLMAVGNDRRGLLGITSLGALQVASILDQALTRAEDLERPPRELAAIRRALVMLSVSTDEAHYQRAAGPWLEQLVHDSGLALYRSLHDVADPGERLTRALRGAAERYAAASEDERVYDPQEAIRSLGHYVAISIALGSRMQDGGLITSLPELLAPFAPLSPVLHLIWQNSIATREATCDNQLERSRERWLQVIEGLADVSSAELSWVDALRGALIYGVGLTEARLGFPGAVERARLLDNDPMQVVSAMLLRKIARLHQGDFAGAEHYRKLAEQRALRANVRPMFSSTLLAELVAYALASDIIGVSQVARAMEPMTARFAGWAGAKHLAEGYFEQIRGNPEAAMTAFEQGLSLSDPVTHESGRAVNTWVRLQGALVEVLVDLGRAEEAKARGDKAVAACVEHEIAAGSFPIRRALALAEAKLGDYATASRRLEGVIDEMQALGVTGLELGATYEARARIAIWFSDGEAIARFGELTAKEYRYGEGSALGARYERLMDEARGRVRAALPQLVDLGTRATMQQTSVDSSTAVGDALGHTTTSKERAERALRLLCGHHAATAGHLYLRTQQGLERVASLDSSEAGEDIDELVRTAVEQMSELFAQDAEENTTATGSGTTGADGMTSSATDVWARLTSARLTPLLLMTDVDGRRACVGAAVVTASKTGPLAGQLTDRLTETVAAHFVRAGDVHVDASSD